MSGYPSGAELTERVFDAMKDKADLATHSILGLGFLAGIYIGLGGLFSGLVLSYAGDQFSGVVQVFAGAVFTLGLAAVLLAGAELFTGNTLMIGTAMTADLPMANVLRALSLAYLANLIGSLLLVALAFGAAVDQFGDGAIGKAIHALGEAKITKSAIVIFFSGVLANFLVCL